MASLSAFKASSLRDAKLEGDLGLLPLGDLDRLDELGDLARLDGERGDLPPDLMPVLPALRLRMRKIRSCNSDVSICIFGT